jgi:ribonucleoside-diphosphate reductase alpha chain
MTARCRLPDRRGAELVDFVHDGRRWTATAGRFDDGRVAEIFLDNCKHSPLAEMAAEAAIVASIALQCGCPIETLRHALAGRGAGPLATALSLIDV